MSVYSWGFGKLGQLGQGDFNSSLEPIAIRIGAENKPSTNRLINNKTVNDNKKTSKLKNCGTATTTHKVADISSGGHFTVVVTQKGDAYATGCGKYGRLGTGAADNVNHLTRIIPGRDTKLSQVSCGTWHSCGVTFLGRLYSWGYNNGQQGILGRSDDEIDDPAPKYFPMPRPVSGLNDVVVKKISCGHNYTLVCTTDCEVYSWGSGRYGVLGHGCEESVPRPKKISRLSGIHVVYIDAGYAHAGVITSDNRLWMFGKAVDGALGLGFIPTSNQTSPAPLNSIDAISVQWKSISCSVGEHRGYTLGLSSSGYVYAWGSNCKGKLGTGDTEPRLLPTLINSIGQSELISNKNMSATFETQSSNDGSRSALKALGNLDKFSTPMKPDANNPKINMLNNFPHRSALTNISLNNRYNFLSRVNSTDSANSSHCSSLASAATVTGVLTAQRLPAGKQSLRSRLNSTGSTITPHSTSRRNIEIIDHSMSSLTGTGHSFEKRLTFGGEANPVICISAGGMHSGAVTADGRVWTWGSGKDGRLGHVEAYSAHTNSVYLTTPTAISSIPPEGEKVVQISCAQYHTVIRTKSVD